MKGAVLGLSWEIVARIRWLYYASGLYFVLAWGVVALVPSPWRTPDLGGWLAMPLLILAGAILGIILFSDGTDHRTRRSGFPRRLLTLPVSSFTLASVPLVLGTVLLGTLWILVASTLLKPCGADFPLVMPALGIAVAAAWLQAITWTPFPFPWLRILLIVAGTNALLAGPFFLHSFGVSLRLLTWTLAGVLVLCYMIALVGVRLGRRGVLAGDRVQLDRGEVGASTVPSIPFSSPLRGQLWLEGRYVGWVNFLQLLVMVLGFLPLFYFMEIAWRRPYMLAAVGPWAEQLGAGWLSVQMVLILPIAFSMIGGDISRQSTPGKVGMSPFYATRAISVPDLFKAKLLATAGFVVMLWGQMLALVLGWAAATGNLGDMMDRLGEVAGAPGAGAAVLAGGVLVGVVVNYLWLLGNLWVGLSGRPWVSGTMLLFPIIVLPAIVLVSKGWRESWYPWLAALVCLGLACKAILAGWVCRKLVRLGYARPRTLTALVGGWMILVSGLASLAAWIFPGGWLTFTGVALVIPLATSLFAPLSLAWDRHR